MGLTSLAYLEVAKEERMKKLSAKEANTTSRKRAAEITQERDEADRKQAEASAKKWRDQRANWYTGELSSIETSIAEAVDKGKSSITVWLATSDEREKAEEKAFWEGFSYKPELKKVIAHFVDLGYEIKFKVHKHENVDLSDLSPRDNWFTYETQLEVRW